MRGGYKRQIIIKGRIYLVIRYALLIALVVSVIVIAAGKADSTARFEDVAMAVSRYLTSDQMEEGADRYLKKIYGLNASDYEDVLIYVPTTNMSAQEMLLIKLSSRDQSEAVEAAIRARIDSQYNIYEGYAPEQVDMLDRAIVDPQGNYILYISCDDPIKIDEVFRNSL